VQVLPAVQQITALLQQLGWECLEHLAYGLNLAPSDVYLVGHFEESSWWSQLQSGAAVKDAVTQFCAEGNIYW
jgi:hypothetical protein